MALAIEQEDIDTKARHGETIVLGGTSGKTLEAQELLLVEA